MKMKFLGGLAVLFGVSFVLLNQYRDEVSVLNRSSAATRQIDRICAAKAQGRVSDKELCSTSIPAIPTFRQAYETIKVVDGEWYASQGLSYFPSVNCESKQPVFKLMDLNYVCEGNSAKQVPAVFSELAVAAEPTPIEVNNSLEPMPLSSEAASAMCYGSPQAGKIRAVVRVERDGTLVLDGKERVKLAGVSWPPDITPVGEKQNCLEVAVKYLAATLVNRSATIYRIPNVPRDAQFRLPVYLVNLRGEFVNQYVLRYGIGRRDMKAIAEMSLKCAPGFESFERAAREKEEGHWSGRCFEQQEETEQLL
jgi:hypothetical protein